MSEMDLAGLQLSSQEDEAPVGPVGVRPKVTCLVDFDAITGNRYLSLLLQFMHPRVRIDFQAGKFVNVMDAEARSDSLKIESALKNMDLLRRRLLPPFHQSGMMRTSLATVATSCLKKLVAQSPELLELSEGAGECPWTYGTWARLLEAISSSDYWNHALPELGSMSIVTNPREEFDPVVVCVGAGVPKWSNDQENVSSAPNLCGKGTFDGSEQVPSVPQTDLKGTVYSKGGRSFDFLAGDKSVIDAVPDAGREIKRGVHRPNSCVFNIDNSTSQLESSDESVVEVHPRRFSTSPYGQHPGYPRKEVVKPVMFEVNGWQSLRRFFQGYERYFEAKYEGDARDCTVHLAEFLPPELKECYDAYGGGRLKYRDMREELLKWYNRQERYGSRYWREQLTATSMNKGETLKVYALRLHEIGRKAYPHDLRKLIGEVRHQFMETVPSEFARYAQLTEDASRVTQPGYRLSWSSLLELAEREDVRKAKLRRRVAPGEQPHVWFSRPGVSCHGDSQCHCGHSAVEKQQSHGSSQQQSSMVLKDQPSVSTGRAPYSAPTPSDSSLSSRTSNEENIHSKSSAIITERVLVTCPWKW